MQNPTSVAEVKKHVRVYVVVFVALAALTLITVSASTFEVSTTAHIAIALFIAVVKGSLVASYFMHLISERKVIFGVLIITVIFFAGLLLLPVSDLSLHGSTTDVP
ncbi:MAG TPA: cytochrome C oxidase subunit IV family protein [Bacteroidota bacterium]